MPKYSSSRTPSVASLKHRLQQNHGLALTAPLVSISISTPLGKVLLDVSSFPDDVTQIQVSAASVTPIAATAWAQADEILKGFNKLANARVFASENGTYLISAVIFDYDLFMAISDSRLEKLIYDWMPGAVFAALSLFKRVEAGETISEILGEI